MTDGRDGLVARAQSAFSQWDGLAHRYDDWLYGVARDRIYRFGAMLVDRGDEVLIDPDGPDGVVTILTMRYSGLEVTVRPEKVRQIATN